MCQYVSISLLAEMDLSCIINILWYLVKLVSCSSLSMLDLVAITFFCFFLNSCSIFNSIQWYQKYWVDKYIKLLCLIPLRHLIEFNLATDKPTERETEVSEDEGIEEDYSSSDTGLSAF